MNGRKIQIVEVGPAGGLHNDATALKLRACGLKPRSTQATLLEDAAA